MTLAESYKLLGVQPGCRELDIKRNFKRLARKLHPDVNPSPQAHEQFIQLTQALEIVLNPPEIPLKKERSSRSQNPTVSPSVVAQRMREAKERFENMEERKKRETEDYFFSLTSGKSLKTLKVVMYLGAIMAFFFLAEIALPVHHFEDELLSCDKRLYNGIHYDNIKGVTLKNTGSYFCEHNASYWDSMYPDLIVEKSWFTHTPIRMIQNDDFEIGVSTFDFHLGSVRWLVIAILLCPLIPYFRPRKTISHVLIFYFSIYIVGIIELYILFSNQRILHFLTLGFF